MLERRKTIWIRLFCYDNDAIKGWSPYYEYIPRGRRCPLRADSMRYSLLLLQQTSGLTSGYIRHAVPIYPSSCQHRWHVFGYRTRRRSRRYESIVLKWLRGYSASREKFSDESLFEPAHLGW
ncbi:hypothetical protein A0H81_02937 [Grifola frondosa]|uniref:Uncharacterized protein n=1 Tax=Grifola frondosa TaxID=5627 RepID=A0A1C7MIV1_GRIFR|nr:hypothetical protein A0H81_02937 [Grifola frondosa]